MVSYSMLSSGGPVSLPLLANDTQAERSGLVCDTNHCSEPDTDLNSPRSGPVSGGPSESRPRGSRAGELAEGHVQMIGVAGLVE